MEAAPFVLHQGLLTLSKDYLLAFKLMKQSKAKSYTYYHEKDHFIYYQFAVCHAAICAS